MAAATGAVAEKAAVAGTRVETVVVEMVAETRVEAAARGILVAVPEGMAAVEAVAATAAVDWAVVAAVAMAAVVMTMVAVVVVAMAMEAGAMEAGEVAAVAAAAAATATATTIPGTSAAPRRHLQEWS